MQTISRYDAIDSIDSIVIKFPELLNNRQQKLVVAAIDLTKNAIENALLKLPSIETEREPGKWIIKRTEIHIFTYCNLCGADGELTWHYCPNCGADMREVQDGEL